ncbi:hypothetical protein EVAR_159_1 [Eumeta japonica]|uniref:Uncharacterized protein n=1 Tax=Eumeta variegata TaxID=151549 RepID=A0A4C1SBP6_EUMVA|nr:hypothetical protein EVAR_159_1 [Eumeta japonica]
MGTGVGVESGQRSEQSANTPAVDIENKRDADKQQIGIAEVGPSGRDPVTSHAPSARAPRGGLNHNRAASSCFVNKYTPPA